MKWKTNTFQPIESTRIFSEKMVQNLKKNHIDTLEDLYALFRIDSVKDHCISLFREDPAVFHGFEENTIPKIDQSTLKWLESAGPFTPEQVPFGCNEPTGAMIQEMEQVMDTGTDPDFMISELGASWANHIHDLPGVRFQGERGTCVAFGTIAVREFVEKKSERLSEQYLYWGAKMRDSKPEDRGTWIRYAMDCLKEEGVCPDMEWPYNPRAGDSEHQGMPPARAIKTARSYRALETVRINPKSVNDLRSVLLGNSRQTGRVISFSVPVFDSWYKNPITSITGRFPMPLPGEAHRGGHCMCLVGYKDDLEWPGGGFFILRNSWGEQWAKDNLYGPGYGVIPYKFMALYGWEAWTIAAGPGQAPGRSEKKNRKIRTEPKHPASNVPRGTTAAGPGSGKYHPARGNIPFFIFLALFFCMVGVLGRYTGERICQQEFLTGPQLQEYLMETGNQALAADREKEAVLLLSKAVELNPESGESLVLKARAFYKKGRPDQAVVYLEKALATSVDKAGIYYQIGLIQQETGQTRQALLSWYAAMDLDPEFTDPGYLIRYFNK